MLQNLFFVIVKHSFIISFRLNKESDKILLDRTVKKELNYHRFTINRITALIRITATITPMIRIQEISIESSKSD
jgi:hypothetical protein